jgi:hypothetical protein
MVTWIWRLYSREQGLWTDIARNKYLWDKYLVADSHHQGSAFWNAIQKAKHIVRNGKVTRFWHDWW